MKKQGTKTGGTPIKPFGAPKSKKQADPPKTKSGPLSKPGGRVENTSK